jgi:hypothetical protein
MNGAPGGLLVMPTEYRSLHCWRKSNAPPVEMTQC